MFKQLIIDNQDRLQKITIIKRDYEFYNDLISLNKIVSFVGARRVGKTFLMFQFINELILKNIINYNQVVFIDFSQYKNEKLNPQILLSNYFEINDKDPFFVFDEIQDIDNFLEFVLFFYNKGYKIFLSGSNSKLLSSELATEFRGRVFQYDVFPLTFKEILRFKDIEVKKNYTTKEKGILNNLLEEIFIYGTYPETILSKDDFFKENLLKDYLDILIYKDLVDRYNIDNEFVIRYLIKKLIGTNTKQLSINKIFNELKSLNIKVGKNTLYNYLLFLENIFFVKQLDNFYSPNGLKKIFLYNLGFRKSLNIEKDNGKNFENFIFLNLIKKYKIINYKLDKTEVDFYIEKEDINIQVCLELNDTNFERETNFGNAKKNLLIIKENKSIKKIPENIEILTWNEFLFNF